MTARFLAPPDDGDVAYEFYAPYAHVPGRFEWIRLRTRTHGTFDAFVLLPADANAAPDVFVNSDDGSDFLHERFPEARAWRVPERALRIDERDAGRTVAGRLRSEDGPLREADMVLSVPIREPPQTVRHGGEGAPRWGSKQWTGWGVDLALRATAAGTIRWAERHRPEDLRAVPAVVTLGSFRRIASRPSAP
ncbi:MAG TPA: hypothetical protein VM681_10770 [Candidatus Thermoplasmatota archaeon]|nr:hypothetical protein [Candidatus Thermoplasmatota archaeon]